MPILWLMVFMRGLGVGGLGLRVTSVIILDTSRPSTLNPTTPINPASPIKKRTDPINPKP